jgi:nitroreductase
MQEPFAQLIKRTLSGAKRTVLYRLIRSPRHVRHFASDPIPTDTLQRILDTAWYGQSVGGRAPGQVFLITSPALHTKITSVVHASCAGDASRPFSSPFAKSVLEPYIRTHGGSTVASCGDVRSLAWWCARARPGTSAGDGHLWCGLDTLIYNDVWGKLSELFPAPRVTFDDHDYLEYSG